MASVVDWSRLTARLCEQPSDLEILEHAFGALSESPLEERVLAGLEELADQSGAPEHAFVVSEARYRAGDVEGALRVLQAARKGAENRQALNRLAARIGPRIQDRLRFFQCHLVYSFTGKDVVEIGERFPPEFVRSVDPQSWTSVSPRVDEEIDSGIYRTVRGADPLLPLPGDSADVVFSSSFFERVRELGALLSEVHRLLRPEGALYSEFSPIWSGASGHHFSGQPRKLLEEAGLWPLEPWAHLKLSPGRMRELLSSRLDPAQVKQVERWLYRRPTLSRFFYEDYVSLLHDSPLEVRRIDPLAGSAPDEKTLKVLRRRWPGRGNFEVRGLRIMLTKRLRRDSSFPMALELPHEDEEQKVVSVVYEHLERAPAQILKFPQAEGRRVFLAQLGDRDLIVKVHHSGHSKAVGCNFAVDVFRRQGVPTPKVVMVDYIGRAFGTPLAILERAKGLPLPDWIATASPEKSQRDAILRELGAHLEKLHAFSWDGVFGQVSDWRKVYGPETWVEYLFDKTLRMTSGERVRLLDLGPIVGGGYLSQEQTHELREFLGGVKDGLGLDRPHLLHNDLSLKHVFVDRGGNRITAVIDLNNAIGGDPPMELARIEYYYRETDYLEPIFEGYGERSEEFLRRQNAYLIFVLVEKLHWLVGREEAFPGRREKDLELLGACLARAASG